MLREIDALVLEEHIAQDAASEARDEPERNDADDVELAVARERRAADDADDHREIVDDGRRQASARIDELGNQGGEEVLQPALLSHARRK